MEIVRFVVDPMWFGILMKCELCNQSKRVVLKIEGHVLCNGCYEKLNPVTVDDQIRWARRRQRSNDREGQDQHDR